MHILPTTTTTTLGADGADGAGGGISTALLVLLAVIGLALLVFFVMAVASILRADRLSSAGKGIWIAICLILQFFGPLAWFLWGRHQRFDGGTGGFQQRNAQ